MFGARARARSTDVVTPWPTAPAFGPSLAYPAGAIALIVYGSLLPFSIDFNALVRSDPLRALTWAVPSVEDFVVNLLLYAPVGLLLALRRRGSIRSRTIRFTTPLLIALTVSLGVEYVQSGIAERVASWIDVCLNVCGAGVGALAGAWIRRIGDAQPRRSMIGALSSWPQGPAIVLITGLFVFGLAPFDFVTTDAGLHDAFRRARWDVTQPRPVHLTQTPWAMLRHELAGAAWFALLGVLLVRSSAGRDRHGTTVVMGAVAHGVMIAGLIEVLQLFTTSHTYDTASILLRSIATALGAWLYVLVVAPVLQHDRNNPDRQKVIAFGLGILFVLQVFWLVADGLQLQGNLGQRLFACRIEGWPFEPLWRAPAPLAFGEMLTTVISAGALSATLAAAVHHRTVRRHRFILPVVGTSVVMLAAEVLRATAGNGLVDVTDAVIGVGVALVVTDAIHRFAQEIGASGRDQTASQLRSPFASRRHGSRFHVADASRSDGAGVGEPSRHAQ